MKSIYIVSQKSNLKELFLKDRKFFEVVVRLEDIEPKIECDLLLLSGDRVSLDEISKVRSLYPEIPIFYKLEDITSQQMMKQVQTICEAYNIKLIRERIVDTQLYDHIVYHTFEQEKELSPRTIGFFGTHSGAGVSTTVMGIARDISQRVDEKVLVLSLNPWDPSDYFLNYQGKYLNDLKIDLKTGTLSPKKFSESVYFYEKEGFYHLAGNRDIKMQRYFTVEEVFTLIELAKDMFDLVLIDAGCHFDNACYAQAFLSTDLKFLVTTQETKGYNGYWPYVYQQLIEPIDGSPESFMLIINRYMTGVSLINEKEMKKQLGMEVLATVPEQDVHAYIASEEKKLLYEQGDNGYRRSIHSIGNSIIANARLVNKDVEIEDKKGFLSQLFSKRTG